jgi:hypothetical protein
MTSYIDNYATKSGAMIEISGVIPGASVDFYAFITSFNDSLSSNWTEEQVYGRQDPIGTFQNTSRKISLSFDLPAVDIAEAKKNLTKVNKVKQFMYPAYHTSIAPPSGSTTTITRNALSLAKSPLVRLKFANLIQNGSEKGLLGWIGSFSATPVIDMGMFNEGKEREGKFFPKVYNVSLDFTPQHEYDLGWNSTGGEPVASTFTKFPYDGGS